MNFTLLGGGNLGRSDFDDDEDDDELFLWYGWLAKGI